MRLNYEMTTNQPAAHTIFKNKAIAKATPIRPQTHQISAQV